MKDGAIIKELKRNLVKAEAKDNLKTKGDILCDLGAAYRQQGNLDGAIEYYSRSVPVCEATNDLETICFSRRALAEIYAERGEETAAAYNLAEFGESAKKLGDHSQIQLFYHVSAWVQERLWVLDQAEYSHLEKGIELALKSMEYLSAHGKEIDADKKAVIRGGASKKRKANLHRLLGGLFGNLRKQKEAEHHLQQAIEYAKHAKDEELLYDCFLARLDCSWIDRTETAEQLIEIASRIKDPRRKSSAMLELAKAKLCEKEDYEGAKMILNELLAKHENHLPLNELTEVQDKLIFLYKMTGRMRILKSAVTRSIKRSYIEKIADACADERMFKMAYSFYEMLLSESISRKEICDARVSLAETARDMNELKETVMHYKEVLKLESTGSDSYVDTENCIFLGQADGDMLSHGELLKEVKRLERRKTTGNMGAVYKAAARYFERAKNKELSEKYKRKGEEWDANNDLNEEDEIRKVDESSKDRFDRMSDDELLQTVREEAELWKKEKKLVEDKEKLNSHGESLLHEAARTDNVKALQKLIILGYDVNRADYGGWTPLSEAVNARLPENVKCLLDGGANVNPMSSAQLEDGQEESGSGVTPLMEACAIRDEKIARILLRYNASVTKKNSDGWTAADFLWSALQDQSLTAVERISLRQLKEDIEKRQREQKFPVRQGEPPIPRCHADQHRNKQDSAIPRKHSPERNLDLYRDEISKLARRDRRRNEGEDEDEDEEDEEDEALDDDIVALDNNEDSSPIENQSTGRKDGNNRKRPSEVNRPSLEPMDNGFDVCERSVSPLSEASTASAKRRRTSGDAVPNSSSLSMIAVVTPPLARGGTATPSFRSSNLSSPDYALSPFSSLSSNVLPLATHIPQPISAQRPILVKVEFGLANTEDRWRKPKIFPLQWSSTVNDLAVVCKMTLLGQKATWCLHGCELEGETPLEQLKQLSGDILTVLCLIDNNTVISKFLKCTEESDRSPQIIACLREFEANGNLELSNIDFTKKAEAVFWQIIDESKIRAGRIHIVKYDLSVETARVVGRLAQNARSVTLRECALDNNLLSILTEVMGQNEKLRVLDLSSNSISDGSVFAHFINNLPSLMDFRGGENMQMTNVADLMQCLQGRDKLRNVSFANCPWFGDEELRMLCPMGGCPFSQLVISDTAVENIHLKSANRLRRLYLARCQLTDAAWMALAEWLRTCSLSHLDVAGSNIPIQVLEAIGSRIVIEMKDCAAISTNQLLAFFKEKTPVTFRIHVDAKIEAELIRFNPNVASCIASQSDLM